MKILKTFKEMRLISFLVFLEGFISPFPSDILLPNYAHLNKERFKTVITVSSVLGCVVGYLLGAFTSSYIDFLNFCLDIDQEVWHKVMELVNQGPRFILIFKTFTPIPNFIVITYIGKMRAINVFEFIFLCLFARAMKYSIAAFALRFTGKNGVSITNLIGVFFSSLMILKFYSKFFMEIISKLFN